MIICGVELKANNIIFSLISNENNEIEYIDIKIKKHSLTDDESQESIKQLKNYIDDFIKEHNINKIVIKKRAKKGTFAGGVLTFKMESIIQLNDYCEVEFISSQSINKYCKNNEVEFPSKLNKYQEQSYLAALISNN